MICVFSSFSSLVLCVLNYYLIAYSLINGKFFCFFFNVLGKQLMFKLAELVPKHPGRTKKQEPVSTSTAGTSKSGKGGKKKR